MMKIMSTLKTKTLTEMSRIKEILDGPPVPSLVTAVENARRDWQQAVREMNHTDGDMAEHIIYKINAAERRYIALLEQAKKEGITAWPSAAGIFLVNEFCPEGSSEVEGTPFYTS